MTTFIDKSSAHYVSTVDVGVLWFESRSDNLIDFDAGLAFRVSTDL
jgi:hypothetical protein